MSPFRHMIMGALSLGLATPEQEPVEYVPMQSAVAQDGGEIAAELFGEFNCARIPPVAVVGLSHDPGSAALRSGSSGSAWFGIVGGGPWT